MVEIRLADDEAREAAIRQAGFRRQLHMVEIDGRRLRSRSDVSRIQRYSRRPGLARGERAVELSSCAPVCVHVDAGIPKGMVVQHYRHVSNMRSGTDQSAQV